AQARGPVATPRPHRRGADPRPRDASVGRADRARRLVRRAPLTARRPEDPPADAARAVRRHVQGHDGGMAREGMTERRAARIRGVCALVVILAQLVVASAWALGDDDPNELALTRQRIEREKGLAVGPADDSFAASASGGALATVVEGNAVTLSVGRSEAEVERLRSGYSASGDPGTRLDLHGRY